ncbi:signal transduction histidine kinase [Aquimarina sp. EL_43]|uniref:ATP-binding protein n=1 Tax=unclassified Aquimarina TaxID=2627091 RepID=UPI0018C9DDE2|nr:MULTISPECIES: ATP-binding protein [unclassified Aquimarina]MBG6130296.1 signal transduction histidine kinase [Aquimarina sp. EL_35]MBG6149076.1 signal transduction histidine kinase [Aquimarina sp. EL_32]MBG6168550.1 signal transduction histidine kinase [Aquimarina sp. EL_43]
MKRYTVLSLFFLCILIGVFFNSCNHNVTDDSISPLVIKKIDSLHAYYDTASNNSNAEKKRLEAIDHFLQGTKKLEIDSLHHKGLSLYIKLLNKYKGPEKAIEQSYLLLQLAQQNKDSVYIGNAFYKLGFYNKKLDNYLEAFGYYNQSFKVHRDLKDSINAGRCLMAMSNVQRTLGDHNACKTTATDGLKYVENSDQYKTICGLYQNISIAFKELGNYNQSLLWNNKIMNMVKDSIAKKKIGIHNLPIFKNTRANILAEQKKYQESIDILQSLLKDQNVIKKRTRFAQILSNLGYIKFHEDSLNPESESLLLKALRIRKEKGIISGLVSSNVHLTKYYRNKNLTKSLHHAKEAYRNAVIKNNQESIFEALDLITDLDTSSIEDHQRFKEASLRLMQLRKKTREIYAPTRFENENLLKENAEKNRKISEVRNENTIYLLGMLLLITGIGFIIYFFKQQMHHLNQQNKIIQFEASYETETRISKQLHDELGNDIFQVMMQYQNDPHNPHIKDKLNTTYLKARDISRENNEFETGDTYPEELNNMLQNYSQNGIQLIAIGFDRIDWDETDKTIKITVYRVLQELMTNMQKHSQANLVKLKFSNANDTLTINYSDNGVGVTEEHVQSKNGLRNTENRIRAIQGTLIFDSEKGKGFKAEIQIPN